VSDYGDVTSYWHGVDAQVSARLSNRLFVQLGSSGDRGVRDFCAVTQQLPELYTTVGALLANQQVGSCAVSEDWLTSIRGLASYTVPRSTSWWAARSTRHLRWRRRNSVASNGNSAVGELLQRLERDSAGPDRAAADAWPGATDDQSPAAGARLPRSP